MKRFILLTLTGSMTLAGAAFADTVKVKIPANVATQEGAQAYTTALDRAVLRVCREENRPTVGLSLYGYRECVQATRADVAAKDPTGLYASRFAKQPSLAMAAK